MATIQTQTDLHNAILHLEQRQSLEKRAMQQHFQETYEYLQPAKLLNNVITEITEADDLKKNMLKAAFALAIGYITKKLIDKYLVRNRTPLTSAIETILQIVISGWVAKNGTILKNVALYLINTVIHHQQKKLSSSQETTNYPVSAGSIYNNAEGISAQTNNIS